MNCLYKSAVVPSCGEMEEYLQLSGAACWHDSSTVRFSHETSKMYGHGCGMFQKEMFLKVYLIIFIHLIDELFYFFVV